jgi:hypothetical protein
MLAVPEQFANAREDNAFAFGINAERARTQRLDTALVAAVSALEKVAFNYFDGSTNPSIACWACDMGDSGRSHRTDRHDDDCPIVNAPQAKAPVGAGTAANDEPISDEIPF